MANRAAAMRYARALFDVCEREGELERIEREVSAFVTLLEEHSALGTSLLSPVVPPARKRAVVAALLDRWGKLSQITIRFLTLLGERDRMLLLPEILELYRNRLMEYRGVVRARITTAAPLPDRRADEIRQRLETVTGKRVTIERDVNPAVIGGVVTQIGSIVWDGSIARHLARLRQQFLD